MTLLQPCVSLDRREACSNLVWQIWASKTSFVRISSNWSSALRRQVIGAFFYRAYPTKIQLKHKTNLRFEPKHARKTHLYLIPRTEVPVTIGRVVCCLVPSMAAAACPAPRAGPAVEWQSILDETRGERKRKAAEHSKCASMQRFLNCKERRTVHDKGPGTC